MLLEPGESVVAGDRSQSQDQLIVWQLVDRSRWIGPDPHDATLRIDTLDVGSVELCVWTDGAHGGTDVLRVQRARRDLGQHRREQHVVALAYEGGLQARTA